MGRHHRPQCRNSNRAGHLRRHQPQLLRLVDRRQNSFHGRRELERHLAREYRRLCCHHRYARKRCGARNVHQRGIQSRNHENGRQICRCRARCVLLSRHPGGLSLYFRRQRRICRHRGLSPHWPTGCHIRRLRLRRSHRQWRRHIHCPSEGRPSDCPHSR